MAALGAPSRAQVVLISAPLTAAQEVPPTSSPGTGAGDFGLDLSSNLLTVDLSFSGLTSPATGADIHGPAGCGMNAPILFTLTAVPAATSGSIPEQTFTLTPGEGLAFLDGQLYANIATTDNPAGDIRGRIAPAAAVPEPGTCALLAAGLLCLGPGARRRWA